MTENQLSPWAIERRIGYPSISEVALAPDGSSVLYVVTEPLLTDEKSEFVSHIYRAALGGEPVQLTFGDYRNDAPRWSPNGRYIAFISPIRARQHSCHGSDGRRGLGAHPL